MKKLSFLITLVAAILTGIVIVSSCSDDGDSKIVGTWEYAYSGSGYYEREYIMFCSDGTYYEFEECDSHGYDVEKGEYSYNENTGRLRLTDYASSGYAYTETVEVEISGNKMYVYSGGSGYHETTFKKVSSPLSKSELERYCRADQGSR